jgi:hypothetical protein
LFWIKCVAWRIQGGRVGGSFFKGWTDQVQDGHQSEEWNPGCYGRRRKVMEMKGDGMEMVFKGEQILTTSSPSDTSRH